MKSLQKYILNFDGLTLVLGGILIYFIEDIVTFFFPTDSLPIETISILYYLLAFSIAAFWILKSIAYLSIKIAWNFAYQYLEYELDEDIKSLTSWQKAKLFLGFYCFLLLSICIVYLGSVLAL